MADDIILIVKCLGIFTVAAQTLLHFCPNKKYEKYIRMLIGSMTIVILMVPLLGLFQKGMEEDIWRRIETYGQDMEKMIENQGENLQFEEVDVLNATKEEIKLKLNDIAKEYGYQIVEVGVTEKETGSFLSVVLSKGNVIQVEQIHISSKRDGKVSREEKDLKGLFSERLGVASDYLEVIICE